MAKKRSTILSGLKETAGNTPQRGSDIEKTKEYADREEILSNLRTAAAGGDLGGSRINEAYAEYRQKKEQARAGRYQSLVRDTQSLFDENGRLNNNVTLPQLAQLSQRTREVYKERTDSNAEYLRSLDNYLRRLAGGQVAYGMTRRLLPEEQRDALRDQIAGITVKKTQTPQERSAQDEAAEREASGYVSPENYAASIQANQRAAGRIRAGGVVMSDGRYHVGKRAQEELDRLAQSTARSELAMRAQEDETAMFRGSDYWLRRANELEQKHKASRSGYGGMMQGGTAFRETPEFTAQDRKDWDKAREYYYQVKNAERWGSMPEDLRQKALEAAGYTTDSVLAWQDGDEAALAGMAPDQRAQIQRDQRARRNQIAAILAGAGYEPEEVIEYASRVRNAERMQQEMAGLSEDVTGRGAEGVARGVYGTVQSYATNLLSPIGSVGLLAQKLFRGGAGAEQYRPVDYNTPSMYFSQGTSTIRGAVGGQMGDVGRFVYDTVNSAVDSGVRMLVGQALGGGLVPDAAASEAAAEKLNRFVSGFISTQMSGEVFANSFVQAKESGSTDADALLDSVTAAVIEGLTEKYSVESILKNPNGLTWTALRNSFLAEGSEEMASDFLNTIYDELKNGDDSELRTKYRELLASGATEDDAFNRVFGDYVKQVVLDGLAGGLSGIAMSGVAEYMTNKRYEKAYADPADTQALLDEARAVNPDSKLLKRAEQRVAEGKGVTGYQARELMGRNEKKLAPLKQASEKYGEQSGAMQATYQEGQDVAQYDMSYRVAYEMGKAGTKLSAAQTSTATDYLTDAQKQAAWSAGRDARTRLSDVSEVANGRALLNGQIAEVQTVSAQDGKLMAEVRQGESVQTVALDSLKVDAGTRTLAEGAKQYGSAAGTVFEQYKAGQDVAAYLRAADMAAAVGMASPSASSETVLKNLQAGQLGKALSGEQITAIYKAGQTAGRAQLRKTGMTRLGTGTVTFEQTAKGAKLNARQKASVQFIRDLAKVTGIDFTIYKSSADSTGRLQGANGAYRDGTVHVDLNAGAAYEGKLESASMLRTVSHELTHYMAEAAPTEFSSLQDFMVQRLSQWEGHSIQDLAEGKMATAEQAGHPITAQEALEEVVADGCEMMLRDSKAVQQLAEENRTLFEKVRDWMKKFFESLRKAFEGVEAVHPESIHMMENYAGELQKLWDEAFTAAVKNAKESGQKNSARTGADVRLSVQDGRLTAESTEQERYELLKDVSIRLASVNEDAVKGVRLEDYNTRKKSAVIPGFRALAKQLGILNVDLQNSEIGFPFQFSGKNLEKSLHHQLEYGGTYQDYVRMMSCFNDLVENAVPIEVHTDKKAGTAKANQELKQVYVLTGAYRDTQNVAPVQFEVKEFEGRGNKLYLSVVLTKISSEVLETGVPGKTGNVPPLFSEPTISLRQIFENVNPADGRFLKYVPDGFLNEAQKNAKAQALRKQEQEYAGYGAKFSERDSTPNVFNPDGKTIDEQLDDVLNTAESFDGRYLYIGRFTQEFVDLVKPYLEVRDLPIVMNYRDAYLAMANKENGKYRGQGINYHNLGKEGLKQAIEAFAAPDAVMQSKKNGKVELVLDGTDYKGNRFLAIVALDTSTRNVDRFIKAHVVTSVYGRRSIDNYIRKASEDGRLVYDKREEPARGISQVQYKSNINADSSLDANVSQTGSAVKWQERDTVSAEIATLQRDLRQMRAELKRLKGSEGQVDLAAAAQYDAREALRAAKADAQEAREQGILAGQMAQGRQDAKAMSRLEATLAQERAAGAEGREALRAANRDIRARDKTIARNDAAIQRLQDRIARTEERLNERIAEQRQRLTDYRKNRNETEAARRQRAQIEARCEELTRMLTQNNDKQHIPEPLKQPVKELLEALTPSRFSQSMQERGTETQADARLVRSLEKIRRVAADQAQGKLSDLGYLDLPPEFLDDIDDIFRFVSDGQTEPLYAMNSAQLKELNQVLTVLTTSIKQINRLITAGHFESVRDAAEATALDLDSMRERKLHFGLDSKAGKAEDVLRNFLSWKNTTPYYAFRRFGEGGQDMFRRLADGWDRLAFNSDRIIRFAEDTYTEKEVKAWEKEKHTVTLDSGEVITLSTANAMELYELSKREQAQGHLYGGGVRISGQGIRPVLLTVADVENIAGLLSERQKAVADRLQQYMEIQGSAWGNEVSMERFGYRYFTEPHYYPVVSDSNELIARDTEAQENSMFRLLNLSATKGLREGANNAIVIGSIFDTFANHMSDMAKYNALALPILDTMKWFNYRDTVKNGAGQLLTQNVKQSIEAVYGSDALRYFTTFIKDLNGVSEGGRGEGFANRMISNYKVAAVAANLRVALLQPTAYVRAANVISPKYLTLALKNAPKALWNASGNVFRGSRSGLTGEMLEHSGIALWKSLGFYDTNIGRGVREQIKNAAGIKEKVVEKSMSLAELGDTSTWTVIWSACKLEQKAKGYTGQALLQQTAERFREVVYATQVVDSTMTRSHMMRSKSTFSKLSTAFMSEPTLSYNMLLDAAMGIQEVNRRGGNGWKTQSGKLFRAFTVFAATAAASALVESLFDAFRDDDDEDGMTKFIQALFGERFLDGNLGQNLLPIDSLPYLKDAVSILQGYSNERMDTEFISKIVNTAKIWAETYKLETGELDKATKVTSYGSMTTWGKVYKTLDALSSTAGLPLAATTREVTSIWNATIGAISPRMKIKRYESKDQKLEWLYSFAQSGSTADYEKEMEGLRKTFPGVKTGEEITESIQDGLRGKIKDHYLDGDLTEQEAQRLIERYTGRDAEEAEDDVNRWHYQRDTGDTDASASMAAAWYGIAEPAGIDREAFAEAWAFHNDVEADKDSNGKTVPGSKKQKVVDYIQGLGLSREQEKALWDALKGNWKDTDTPWE